MSHHKDNNDTAYAKSARVWSSNPAPTGQTEMLAASSGLEKHVRKNKSLLGRSKKEFDLTEYTDADFEKTTSKLMGANFHHHDPHLCVCESCECGRHLCSFKNVKPDLTKTTIYGQSFGKKTPVCNKVNIAKEYNKLEGPHIGM